MEEQNLKLQAAAKRYVHSIGRWYKFFAVVSIVGMALMVLGALSLILAGGLMADAMAEANPYPFPMWVLGVIYLVSAGLMLLMVIYLMRAASAARTAVALNNNEAALAFIRNTKSYWKFYGILTIVILGICVLVIPAAAIAGALAVL